MLILKPLFQMDIFDCAEKYAKDNVPLIVLAGFDYGTGSSRDWAAKGPYLLVSYLFTSNLIHSETIFFSKFVSYLYGRCFNTGKNLFKIF